MAMKSSDSRYGSVARVLHWGIALMIAGLLVSGNLAGDASDEAGKIFLLRGHVAVGISILVFILFRIVWWQVADNKPRPLKGTSDTNVLLAKIVHVLLYIVPLAMVTSGISMMLLTGAGEELFFKVVGKLPDFNTVLPRLVHGVGAKVLVAFAALHIAAGLYHHFFQKDGILRRMWFGE